MPSRFRSKLKQGIILFVAILGITGYVIHKQRVDRLEAEQQARYASFRNESEYTAHRFPYTLTFPGGFVSERNSYYPFVWNGEEAELAECEESVDGACWAEFYKLPEARSSVEFLETVFANEKHGLVRSSIRKQFFNDSGDNTDGLKGAIVSLSDSVIDGWRIRASIIPTPYGGATVNHRPPEYRSKPTEQEVQDASNGLNSRDVRKGYHSILGEGPSDPQAAHNYSEAERKAKEKLRQENEEAKDKDEKYKNSHSNFYMVEAAREVAPGNVVVLRFFGPERSENTIGWWTNEILKMARSGRQAQNP